MDVVMKCDIAFRPQHHWEKTATCSLPLLGIMVIHKEHFLSSEHFGEPIIFEIFIDDYHDEEKEWELLTSTGASKDYLEKQKIKTCIKSVIGERGRAFAKKILRKQ